MAEKSAGKYRAFPLPELYDVAVEYGVALSPRASAAALDFFLTLLSPSGQAALRRAGFVPIAEPASDR